MKSKQAITEEITAIMVACRLTTQINPIDIAYDCIYQLNRIKKYGEITGLKRNSILKDDTGAYVFIKTGVPIRVLDSLTPLINLITHSEILHNQFQNGYQNLVKKFDKKISEIEKRYPRAPMHIKNRLR